MRLKLTNKHHSPLGVFDATGQIKVIKPGQSRELDLTDAEANAIMKDKGLLRATQVGVSVREEERPAPIGEPPDDDGEPLPEPDPGEDDDDNGEDDDDDKPTKVGKGRGGRKTGKRKAAATG